MTDRVSEIRFSSRPSSLRRWSHLGAVLIAVAIAFAGYRHANAQTPNRVALVVQYAPEAIVTRCIEFTEPEITGLEVLQRSGLEIVHSGGAGGTIVCKIGETGCSQPGNCFCQCQGTDCMYWSYWHLQEDAWQYSIIGASLYRVQPGTVEGWTWGVGTPSDAPKPPLLSFDEICRIETPTPTSTDTPAATNTLVPTGTPLPSPASAATPTVLTKERTATAVPTSVATATHTAIVSEATPASLPADNAPSRIVNYAVFGVLILVLIAIAIFRARRS
jgi:hypothetical protein